MLYVPFLGIFGVKICYFASNRISSLKYLARTVGAGYALGILLQFINNNLVRGNSIQSLVLIVGMLLLYVLAKRVERETESDYLNEQLEMKSVKWSVIMLVIVTALLTLIFSTLDNAVTLVHASGEFDIGQWPRLILALSGILAGFLYDIKERRYMSFIMYAITLLSVICIVIIELGGPFIMGLITFYISAGFLVVFFLTAFMEVSYYTTMPMLWAGLGRGVNNICAFATTVISLSLLNRNSPMLILIVALVLFVFISAAMLMYDSFSRTYKIDNIADTKQVAGVAVDFDNIPENVSESENEIEIEIKNENVSTFEHFGEKYDFTKREIECLEAIVSQKCSVQEIAVNLSISRAALYRHIASMNEKTNTKNRNKLIHLYYENLE